MVYPTPTYMLYHTLAEIQSAPVVAVPFDDSFILPVERLLAAQGALTFVANPNSPSGTAAPRERLTALATALDGLLVIDEVHTPDSSRYYYADGYEHRLAAGAPQRQLSKEFVREWLMANGFQGLDGQTLPDMTPEFVAEASARYVELYETVTGQDFVPELSPEPEARVREALRGI